MNVSSISQQAYAMPQVSAQQLSAAAAVSDDSFDDSAAEAGASSLAPVSTSAASSGGTTATLSSQTLQALLDLTQNDPAGQQATQGAQSHRHHHHGGGATQEAPAPDPATETANDPTASIAELDSSTASGSDDSDSLATALSA